MSRVATRQIRVSGVVQGVGFRAAMCKEARALGVRGWVRNRSDGSVEALVQGTPAAVQAIVAWARRGPPGAHVTDLRIDENAVTDGLAEGFELRPTV